MIYGRSYALQKQCSLILIKFPQASSCIRWFSGAHSSTSSTISVSRQQETVPWWWEQEMVLEAFVCVSFSHLTCLLAWGSFIEVRCCESCR